MQTKKEWFLLLKCLYHKTQPQNWFPDMPVQGSCKELRLPTTSWIFTRSSGDNLRDSWLIQFQTYNRELYAGIYCMQPHWGWGTAAIEGFVNVFPHTEFSPYGSAFIFWQCSRANTALNTPTTPKHQQLNQKRPPQTPQRLTQILTCADCAHKAKIIPQALCFWSAAAPSSSNGFIHFHQLDPKSYVEHELH